MALKLSNASTIPTTGWQVSFSSNGSTLSNSWNAAFSATTGAITITSDQSWNGSIPAGATNQDVSVGFCANRSSGQALPVIIDAVPH